MCNLISPYLGSHPVEQRLELGEEALLPAAVLLAVLDAHPVGRGLPKVGARRPQLCHEAKAVLEVVVQNLRRDFTHLPVRRNERIMRSV